MDPKKIVSRIQDEIAAKEPPEAPARTEMPRVPDHELVRRIGAGSYGEVWLARSITGQWRAVKVIVRADFWNERPYEREFRGILQFEPISRSHAGLVHVLHVGRDDGGGLFYYVMELADPAVDHVGPAAPDKSNAPGAESAAPPEPS